MIYAFYGTVNFKNLSLLVAASQSADQLSYVFILGVVFVAVGYYLN